MKLDEFRSCRLIDIIAKTNPILIIDEPQSVEGKRTKERLEEFNPLFTLRYSATHKSDSIYNNSIFAEMFEEEYGDIIGNLQIALGDNEYIKYLEAIPVSSTHAGYFSIDKKGHITNSKLSDKKEKTSDDMEKHINFLCFPYHHDFYISISVNIIRNRSHYIDIL